MPVYNTAEFVEEAILSITAQTLTDIEIIVINDGSTDNSLQVIHELLAKDNRIKVYTQENKGPGATRNRGLDLAQGEYVYFMDSDDLLDKNALLECYEKCQNDDLDFVFFDADTFGEPSMHLNENFHRTHLLAEDVESGISRLEFFFANSGYECPPWLNFINRSYLKKAGLKFNPDTIHDDELFTFLLYMNAARVGYLPKTYFKRRYRANSIMTSGFTKKSLDGYMIVLEELNAYKKMMHEKKVTHVIDYRIKDMLNSIMYSARSMRIRDRQRLLRDCLGQFREYSSLKNLLLLAFPLTKFQRN